MVNSKTVSRIVKQGAETGLSEGSGTSNRRQSQDTAGHWQMIEVGFLICAVFSVVKM